MSRVWLLDRCSTRSNLTSITNAVVFLCVVYESSILTEVPVRGTWFVAISTPVGTWIRWLFCWSSIHNRWNDRLHWTPRKNIDKEVGWIEDGEAANSDPTISQPLPEVPFLNLSARKLTAMTRDVPPPAAPESSYNTWEVVLLGKFVLGIWFDMIWPIKSQGGLQKNTAILTFELVGQHKTTCWLAWWWAHFWTTHFWSMDHSFCSQGKEATNCSRHIRSSWHKKESICSTRSGRELTGSRTGASELLWLLGSFISFGVGPEIVLLPNQLSAHETFILWLYNIWYMIYVYHLATSLTSIQLTDPTDSQKDFAGLSSRHFRMSGADEAEDLKIFSMAFLEKKKHILKHIKCLSWFMMWGFPFSFELPRVFCDWIFWRSVFHWTFRSCPISMRERTRRKRKTRRKPTHDGDWSLSTCWIALKIGVEVDASQGLHPSPFRKYELENGHQQNEKINICTSPRSQWSDLVDFKTNHERWLVTALPNDAQDNGDAKKASQAGMHASGHLVMGLMAENPMNQSRLVVCSFLIHTSS